MATAAQRTRTVAYTRAVLADLEPDITRLTARLHDSLAGWPTNGDNRSSNTVADPTPNLALRPDPAAADLQRLDTLLAAVRGACSELDDLRRRWKPQLGARACRNEHGCPALKQAAPGRQGRCQACWTYLGRNGRDRTLADTRTVAA